ncbi:hypothetical protein LIER_38256 [Lithospermum erythrorhizon]|uniref:Retrotransposon Copia-like N-terminal domain-containing protein n=1 Tax=Lithospermum erythrorhizon TaxID=34254 RepID=A0AAV3PZ55_LITER
MESNHSLEDVYDHHEASTNMVSERDNHDPDVNFFANANVPLALLPSTAAIAEAYALIAVFDQLQLHHSYHPIYVLSTRFLNTQNYHHLRRSIEISLLAKNKLSFVNGEFPLPEDLAMAAEWGICNGMLI